MKPPFRADHVGSFLRPARLKEARERRDGGEIGTAELRAVEDEEIAKAITMQERAGLHAITDGEFRRTSFHTHFLLQIEGVALSAARLQSGGTAPRPSISAILTTKKLSRPRAVSADEFLFVQRHTQETAKITLPSPSMLHFRGGRDAVDRAAYPDMDEFLADVVRIWRAEIADLAALGCRYVQLDDTNLAYLCDPAHRARVKERGDDPDALALLYARMIADVFAGRPSDMAATVHLCRGNFQSTWMAEGGYEPVAEAMFGACDVDGFFLEYDDARSGGFEPLRFVPKGKKVVLGLVSSKIGDLESKDAIKRRIDEAARFVPLDQLCLSPQCGFSSTVHGNKLTPEAQERKLALVADVAQEMWGTAQ